MGQLHPQVICPQIRMGIKMDDMQVRVSFCCSADRPQRQPPKASSSGGRIINTHPALLPAFPGAHGVRDALAHGVKVTGCSVIEVDAGVDTGRILAQRAVDVLEGDTEESLHERIKAVEQPLLVEVVRRLTAAR